MPPPPPVTITFLGGLSDIGRNCAAIESDGQILVLDCGALFANENQPGVNFILPDMDYLFDRADSIVGCLLTHAHEDHIGALRYFLGEVDCPVYGSAFTLGLVSRRLSEWGVSGDFVEVQSGDVLNIGPFECELLNVTHSVPGGHITALTTPQGVILHSSDFKLDETPVDGVLTDLERIKEISREKGIRLLLADSTNSDLGGISESESSVTKALQETFDQYEGHRIFVACFSSHLHRVQQIVNVAEQSQRRIAVMGYSMRANIDLARKLNILEMEDYLSIRKADGVPDGELCVISTGSQAEEGSALATAAQGKSSNVDMGENDAVILSANPIPGNEARVYRMINDLTARGTKVAFGSDVGLHTTGHGKRGELKILHETANAEWFVPVHGEHRHLLSHQELAISLGMKRERALLALDGDQIQMHEDSLKLQPQVTPGTYIFTQAKMLWTDQRVTKERLELANDGIVSITGNVVRHKLVGKLFVDSRGWIANNRKDEIHGALSNQVTQAVKAAVKAKKSQTEVNKIMRKSAREAIKHLTGGFPTLLTHLSNK